MTSYKNEVRVAIATLVLVGYVFALSLLTPVMSAVTSPPAKLANSGSVVITAGVGVYLDSQCTNKVETINWGSIAPGSSVGRTVYIRNEGNSAATLSMSTSNWNPTAAQSYLTLTWNYNNQPLTANQVVQVTFTLAASSSTTGVTTFSFDIEIVAIA